MIKKVLVVAPESSLFTAPLMKAISLSGQMVKLFDTRGSFLYNTKIGQKVVRKIPKIKYKIWDRINQKLLKAVAAYQPDFLLTVKAENISPQTIGKINRWNTITANYYPDFVWNWDKIKAISPVYKFFFSPDRYVLNLLRKQGLSDENLFYLPFASDVLPNQNSNPFINRKDIYDISVIASLGSNLYDKRVSYLKELTDFNLHIWGSKDWRQTELVNHYYGSIKPDKVAGIYNQSKIVINIHYDKEPAEGVCSRPFEAAASGALIVSDVIRKDIFNLFKVDEEFVPFENSSDLKQKVKYYLEHQTERRKIAQAAYQRVIKEHTYYHRWQEILKITKNQ